MASIDFSNRDPKDPNGIAGIKSSPNKAWIKTDKEGAWQGALVVDDVSPGPDYRSVGYATVTTNDGRQYRAVLDGQGQPISVVGDSIGSDKDVETRWQQTQTTTKAPNGQQYSRGADGTINEWNPNSNPPGYNIPHPEMSPAGAIRSPDQKREDAANATKAETSAQNEQALNDERSWNEQHGYGRVTHAERATQARQDEIQARADQNQARITSAQEAANQLARDRLQFDRDQASRPANKPEDIVINGQHYQRITSVKPDGTTTVQVLDPSGKPIAALPAEGGLPAGLPQFTPNKDKPAMGLTDYAQGLYALGTQKNSDGTPKITQAQIDQLLTFAHQAATAEATRLDTERAAQQQQTTNAINQRQTDITASTNRLNSANTATQNALDTSIKFAGMMTPKSYGAMGGPILPAVMALQDARAAGWGGMYQPPPITGPGTMPGAPGAAPAAVPNPNGVIPAVSTMLHPNQLGLGAIGSMPAPGAPGLPQGAPAVAGPPPPLGQGQDISTPPPAGVNPPAGQPGNDPSQPVGMAQPQQPIPATVGLSLMASLAHKYPPDILAEAARQLGLA